MWFRKCDQNAHMSIDCVSSQRNNAYVISLTCILFVFLHSGAHPEKINFLKIGKINEIEMNLSFS